jgi:hypothetical protein
MKCAVAAVILSAVALSVQADEVDTMPPELLAQHVTFYSANTVGGNIQLTNIACQEHQSPGDVSKMAFSTNGGGEIALRGCWTMAEPNVNVVWTTGERYSYNMAGFHMTAYGHKIVGQ